MNQVAPPKILDVNEIEDTPPHDREHLCPVPYLMFVELFCPSIP